MCAVASPLWRSASQSGRLCHGDGGHEGGAHRRMALLLPVLSAESDAPVRRRRGSIALRIRTGARRVDTPTFTGRSDQRTGPSRVCLSPCHAHGDSHRRSRAGEQAGRTQQVAAFAPAGNGATTGAHDLAEHDHALIRLG
jgi:hypothetical protein